MGETEGRGGLEEECAPGGRLVLWDSGGRSSLAWPGAPPQHQEQPVVDRVPTTRPAIRHPAVPGARLRRQAGRPDGH